MPRDLCDDPTATPVRRSGFIDHTRERGVRMCWQFWYADGSSRAVFNPKAGFKLTERMMKAGTIEPALGDRERAAVQRALVRA